MKPFELRYPEDTVKAEEVLKRVEGRVEEIRPNAPS